MEIHSLILEIPRRSDQALSIHRGSAPNGPLAAPCGLGASGGLCLVFCGLFAWYAVQVHQTKYLVEIGFAPLEAAWALGLVSVVAIPDQIALGALWDRIGRESVWMTGCIGFAICYAVLIGL